LPISALLVLLVRFPKKSSWPKLLLLAGALVTLVGSYSRSAWLGALLAAGFIGLASINTAFIKKYKVQFSAVALSVVIVVGLVAYGLHSSARFQNIVFHTQTHSSSPVSSDQAHLSALSEGIRTVLQAPFGSGPGTSGPASIYNHDAPARIPENYFLEIGEESGILGIVLFVAINLAIGYLLWRRRNSPFALALLAALIGISFVNLLSLAWTDDTLSYVWWGLAGVALAMPAKDTDEPPQYPADQQGP
jgi:O-antigen ligase